MHVNEDYYDVASLDETIAENNSLSCIHVNIRSCRKNLDELLLFLDQLNINFTIIVLSETWMDNVDAFLDIPGSEAYHSVREGKKGGGVSILVSKNLKSNLVLTRNCNVYESCLVAVERGRSKLHVLGVYRPPGHTVSDFNSLFFDELADVIGRPKNLIMCDDFNIDTLCVIDDN